MILQERYGRSQNSQDVFVHRSCKCIAKLSTPAKIVEHWGIHPFSVPSWEQCFGDGQVHNSFGIFLSWARIKIKMPYSSSLSDKEWEIIEPLLPKKKLSPDSQMDKAPNSRVECSISWRMAAIGETCPQTCHRTQRCFGTIKTGVVKAYSMKLWLRFMLRYGNVPKKTAMDTIVDRWLRLRWRIPALLASRPRDFASTNLPTGESFGADNLSQNLSSSNAIWQSIH